MDSDLPRARTARLDLLLRGSLTDPDGGVASSCSLIRDAGHTGPAFVSPEVNAMMDEFFNRALKLPPEPPPANPAVLTEGPAKN